MNQQELVWVKLPFSNLRESKVRPALIVSNDRYNKSNPDIIVCAITSKLKESPYSVLIESNDLSSGNLPIKSRVRADKIMQIEKGLIIKAFAKLESKAFDKVINEIVDLVRRKD